jgi:hypothetical protein
MRKPILILSSQSCLFVGENGVFRVSCPFSVICIVAVKHYSIGDIVEVTEVKHTKETRIVYVIEGSYFFHNSFVLLFLKGKM